MPPVQEDLPMRATLIAPLWSQPLRLAELPQKRRAFSLTPDVETRNAIAKELGLLGLRKVRFSGEITPYGASDWRLNARLGATVVQTCVLTLAPVTTRIDENISRGYLAESAVSQGDGEHEMPGDETLEPLGEVIDPGLVMVEALALALPSYPRALGAELTDTDFAGPGIKPMTDEDARPFAGLKGLREKFDDHTK